VVYQQAFSRIGGVSDHMHPPAGIAGGDQLGQRSGVCDLPEVPRSPQPGVSPYFRHRWMQSCLSPHSTTADLRMVTASTVR